MFRAYEHRQIAVRNTDNSIIQLDEKCHLLDRKFMEYTNTAQLKELMEPVALKEQVQELETKNETLEKQLKELTVSSST